MSKAIGALRGIVVPVLGRYGRRANGQADAGHPTRMTTLRCCMKCASIDLRMPGVRDGIIPGFGVELNSWVCRDCGHRAPALEFDDVQDYQAFRSTTRRSP